jgi:hypothetical protein
LRAQDQKVEPHRMTACSKFLVGSLPRKPQTITYANYASGLSFSRALKTLFFLNGLQESTVATGR